MTEPVPTRVVIENIRPVVEAANFRQSVSVGTGSLFRRTCLPKDRMLFRPGSFFDPDSPDLDRRANGVSGKRFMAGRIYR